MRIETLPAFRQAARRLNARQRAELEAALRRLPEAFGRPHVHSGLGIRRFGDGFELRAGLRAGLKLRALFDWTPPVATFVFVGTHDEVAAFVRARR